MKDKLTPKWAIGLVAAVLTFSTPTNGADISVKVADKAVPEAFSPPIRAKLQGKSVQLVDGGNVQMEFWFSSDITLTAPPESAAKSLDALRQNTLLGVVSVRGGRRDYRNDELVEGLYTMRFGLQPQDGDHLGTAEFPYFAVLIPAKNDTKAEGFASAEAMTKASSKEVPTGHPVILSLRPVSSGSGDAPSITEPAPDHKCLRVKLADKGALVFDIVIKGKAKK
jgi:hypothetical protein